MRDPIIPLPPWLCEWTWCHFQAQRHQLGHPLTPRAARSILRRLERAHVQGCDANVMLQTAIVNDELVPRVLEGNHITRPRRPSLRVINGGRRDA